MEETYPKLHEMLGELQDLEQSARRLHDEKHKQGWTWVGRTYYLKGVELDAKLHWRGWYASYSGYRCPEFGDFTLDYLFKTGENKIIARVAWQDNGKWAVSGQFEGDEISLYIPQVGASKLCELQNEMPFLPSDLTEQKLALQAIGEAEPLFLIETVLKVLTL